MKWFKHYCTKRMHNEVVCLMDRFGFHKGYACYFLLLEYCAERFENEDEILIHVRTLKHLLGLSDKKLENFLRICTELEIFTVQLNKKTYSIYWPELIDLADEYSKKIIRKSKKSNEKNLDIVQIHKKEKKDKKELCRIDTRKYLQDLIKSIS